MSNGQIEHGLLRFVTVIPVQSTTLVKLRTRCPNTIRTPLISLRQHIASIVFRTEMWPNQAARESGAGDTGHHRVGGCGPQHSTRKLHEWVQLVRGRSVKVGRRSPRGEALA